MVEVKPNGIVQKNPSGLSIPLHKRLLNSPDVGRSPNQTVPRPIKPLKNVVCLNFVLHYSVILTPDLWREEGWPSTASLNPRVQHVHTKLFNFLIFPGRILLLTLIYGICYYRIVVIRNEMSRDVAESIALVDQLLEKWT